MSPCAEPAPFSAEERLQEIAVLLAKAILRLDRGNSGRTSDNLPDLLDKRLDVSPETSVSSVGRTKRSAVTALFEQPDQPDDRTAEAASLRSWICLHLGRTAWMKNFCSFAFRRV